eukprot:7382322-Prymnesium_polylepis.1
MAAACSAAAARASAALATASRSGLGSGFGSSFSFDSRASTILARRSGSTSFGGTCARLAARSSCAAESMASSVAVSCTPLLRLHRLLCFVERLLLLRGLELDFRPESARLLRQQLDAHDGAQQVAERLLLAEAQVRPLRTAADDHAVALLRLLSNRSCTACFTSAHTSTVGARASAMSTKIFATSAPTANISTARAKTEVASNASTPVVRGGSTPPCASSTPDSSASGRSWRPSTDAATSLFRVGS